MHGVDSQPLLDQPRPLLVRHTSRQLRQTTYEEARYRDDRIGVGACHDHLFPAFGRLEASSADRTRLPAVRPERGDWLRGVLHHGVVLHPSHSHGVGLLQDLPSGTC